jgi:hypothetical protein
VPRCVDSYESSESRPRGHPSIVLFCLRSWEAIEADRRFCGQRPEPAAIKNAMVLDVRLRHSNSRSSTTKVRVVAMVAHVSDADSEPWSMSEGDGVSDKRDEELVTRRVIHNDLRP